MIFFFIPSFKKPKQIDQNFNYLIVNSTVPMKNQTFMVGTWTNQVKPYAKLALTGASIWLLRGSEWKRQKIQK